MLKVCENVAVFVSKGIEKDLGSRVFVCRFNNRAVFGTNVPGTLKTLLVCARDYIVVTYIVRSAIANLAYVAELIDSHQWQRY